jgi:hypothetical protein
MKKVHTFWGGGIFYLVDSYMDWKCMFACYLSFCWYKGLNSGLCICQAGTPPLEPYPFLLYFSDRVLCSCLGLASDFNPPACASLHSWNYRHKPPHQAYCLRWILPNFSAWAGFEPQSSWFLSPQLAKVHVFLSVMLLNPVFCAWLLFYFCLSNILNS